jgi:hypothetical protein
MDHLKLKQEIEDAKVQKEIAKEKMKELTDMLKAKYNVSSFAEATTLLTEKTKELGKLTSDIEARTGELEAKYASITS